MNWRVEVLTIIIRIVAWLLGTSVTVSDMPVTITSDEGVGSETFTGSTSDTTH